MARSTWSSWIALLGLLAACLLLPSCGGADPEPPAHPRPRLVILYSTCTLQRDLIAPYSSVPYTPNLAAFAAESLTFQRHTTETGQSGIAFASLVTGAQSDVHGVYYHPWVLSDDLVLLPEVMADGGYETWFWSGQPMAAASLNYGQGIPPERSFDRAIPFTKQVEQVVEPEALRRLTANDADFEVILDRLEADPDYRAYAQIFFTATHEPYHQYVSIEQVLDFAQRFPELSHGVTEGELRRLSRFYEKRRFDLTFNLPEARVKFDIDDRKLERLAAVLDVTYRATIEQFDRLFGEFIDRLRDRGLLDDTVIAFTADHGEAQYRESALFHWTHGLQLAPEVLNVPLIVHAPGQGIRTGSYEGVTRSIDVYPTLLGLCGLGPAGDDVQGRDLSPAMRGEEPEPKLLAFSHTNIMGEKRLERFSKMNLTLLNELLPSPDVEYIWTRVRSHDRAYKLRRRSGGEFAVEAYDLTVDPLETHDVFEPTSDRDRRMGELLERYKGRLIDAFHDSESQLSDDKIVEILQGLGYVD